MKYNIKVEIEELNLKLAYANTGKIAALRHRLRYIFRSLTDDVLDSLWQIKGDFSEFSFLSGNTAAGDPSIFGIDLLENTLQLIMKPPTRLIKPYGYFVNLPKYAALFGLRQVEYGPEDEPVKTLPCEFKRKYVDEVRWGDTKMPGKFVLFAKYDGADWHALEKELVIGEFCSGPRVKRWVPKQEDDKWNFWDPP